MDRPFEEVPPPAEGARSLGELLRSLAADGAALVRQELALFRAETKRNVRAVGRETGKIAAGAAVAGVGLLVLVAALVAFLGDVMGGRYALAALIVGVVFVAAGAALALAGVRQMRAGSLAPDQALAAARVTSAWARAEVKEMGAVLKGERTPEQIAANTRAMRRDGNGIVLPAPRGRVTPERIRTAQPSGGTAPAASKEPLAASAPLWKRVLREYSRDDITNQAAKVAYYFFLSLPPAIMALFALAGFFGGQGTADWLTARLSASLPQEAGGLVTGFVNDVVRDKAPGPFTIGLLLALWSATNVFTSLEDTLNVTYDVQCERGFVKRRLIALGVLIACTILFLSGSVVLIGGPAISSALGLGSVGDLIWNIVQWPLTFALVAGTFWIIYYVLPNVEQSTKKKTLVKSASIAAALWLLAALAFRLYITNFGSYSKTYGVLGTVIVLLLWMWLTSLVILLGGEISSEMERTA